MNATWNDVLAVPGLSSALNRRHLNQAVSDMGPARILEVGSWLGSTAVAMCHGNAVQYIHCVDNYSEFGGTADSLRNTCSRFGFTPVVHDADYWALPEGVFFNRTFNVYLYDGPHERERHETELAIAWPHLERRFLYIVDDYGFEKVCGGCLAGLRSMQGKFRITQGLELESHHMNDAAGFWNGMRFLWIQKEEPWTSLPLPPA
jgi:hypothetical protein